MPRKMKSSGVKWIGEIPQDWDTHRIKLDYAIYAGATPKSKKKEYWDGNVNWVTPSDFKTEDKFVSTGKRNLSAEGLDACSASMLPVGSIIFSKRAPIGTVAISTEKLSTNQGCLGCVPKKNANSTFAYYCMSVAVDEFNIRGQGTTFMEISTKDFSVIKMPYPSRNEQEAIVHYLDSCCTAIDRTLIAARKSIQKLEEYKASLITKAVTRGLNPMVEMQKIAEDWIGKMPKHWKYMRTKYLFEILKRIAGKKGYDILAITQRGIEVKDISTNKGQIAADYSKYQLVYPGDFAMNHMDLLTGWMDLSDKTGVTSPDYRVFRKCSPLVYNEYYRYVFQNLYTTRVYYGLAQGVAEVGRKRLQAPAFRNFRLPVPPLDEQKAIVAYLDKETAAIDRLIAQKQQLIEKFTEYKQSLIYAAVTGKIDCREEALK